MQVSWTLAFIAHPGLMALFFAILAVYLVYAVAKFLLSLVTGG